MTQSGSEWERGESQAPGGGSSETGASQYGGGQEGQYTGGQYTGGQYPPGQYAGGQYPPPPYGQGGQWGGGGYGPKPDNYLVWAILSTLFCCLPLGIVSIVFSTKVDSLWAMGDVQGAREASEKAKKFAIWSAIAAAVLGVLYILLVVVVGVGFGSRTNYNY